MNTRASNFIKYHNFRLPFKKYLSGRQTHSEVRKLVDVYVNNGVGVIVLNDPKKLNALTEDMGYQFVDAVSMMKRASQDQLIRSCIITGSGDAFSAGGDLDWLRARHYASPYANKLTMIKFYNLFLCVKDIPVPTIAAINGAAIGAGMCMTLACDFRIAAHESKIGFTFAKLGIHPGMGASYLLPRVISSQLASDYLLTGKIVSGDIAKRDGLVLDAVPKVHYLAQ
jgi:enoyl-CoA hydratase/carnithine racemase